MTATYQALRDEVQLLIQKDDFLEIGEAENTQIDNLDLWLGRAVRRFYRGAGVYTPPFEFLLKQDVIAGSNIIPIPANYVKLRRIYGSVENRDFTMAKESPEFVLNNDPNSRVSVPTKFAYEGRQWITDRVDKDVTFNISYYGELDPITEVTDASTSHWLLNNASEALVYWAAVESGLYYRDLAQFVQAWEGKANEVIAQIVEQFIAQESSGSTPKSLRFYRQQKNRSNRYLTNYRAD